MQLTRDHLLDAYRRMRRIREFEERSRSNFRTGTSRALCTCTPVEDAQMGLTMESSAAQRAVIDAAGHMPLLERADQVNSLIADHVAAVEQNK